MTAKRLRDGSILNIGPYDALNRKQYDWNGAALGYDNLGHVTSASLNGYSVSMAYDALGRKTSESGSLGTIGYQYDLAGGRTRITWPDGFSVTYARDATEEVTDIYESGSFDLAHYSYDDLGERTGITRGNDVSTGYGYDTLSRLNALSHTLVSSGYNQSLGFTRNAAGQIIGRTSTNSAYDWSSATSGIVGSSPDGLNRISTSGPYTFAYDGRGNLTFDGHINSYSYTPTNQLYGYSNSSGASASLYYDPLGRLALTSGSTTSVTQFAYAGDQLIAEYDGSAPARLLRRYVPGASGADDPILWYEGNSTADRRWLLDDERGSVIGATNAAGALIGSPNTYNEYGLPGDGNQGSFRFQYTGQLWIPEIGLYHYKARTYSPTLGRFMQTDPIGYKSDLDLYAYVHDDPVNHGDPSGQYDCADQDCKTAYISHQPNGPNGPQITFKNDDPKGKSPDQPVTTKTADMVEKAVLKSGVSSVNINSTTGGVHGANSNHGKERAVDIDHVNGDTVRSQGASSAVKSLQNAFGSLPENRENFGPAEMQKRSDPSSQPVDVNNSKLMEDHEGHIHESSQP